MPSRAGPGLSCSSDACPSNGCRGEAAPGALCVVCHGCLRSRPCTWWRAPVVQWIRAIVGEVDAQGEAIALASVEGRRRDVVFDTSGGQVPSTSISAIVVRAFPQVQRYQLVQEGRTTYRIKVVQGATPYPEADVAAELSRWLGSDAEIEVASVSEIRPLASGKHRPVAGRYDPRVTEEPPS